MVTFNTFIKRFSKADEFIRKKANEILMKEDKRIVKMQQEQHHDGVNRDDKTMQSGYSTGYTKRRKKKGLQTRFVDLHFSGKYHKSLKVKPVKEGLDVESNVEYEKYIREMFPGLAGLTKDNAEVISNILANKLAPELKKYLVK